MVADGEQVANVVQPVGDTGQPGVPVQQVADGAGGGIGLVEQEQWDLGVQIAASGGGHDPAGRGQRHAGVHRVAVVDGGDRAAAPQVRDDRPTEVVRRVDDRLERQAVEAVAA